MIDFRPPDDLSAVRPLLLLPDVSQTGEGAVNSFLGLDPGLSGAVAKWTPEANTLIVFDVPTIERTVAGKKKRQIDMHQLARFIDVHRGGVALAVIELVGSMPSQGVTSAFNFGFTAGAMQMALAAFDVPMATVPPQVWKKAYGLLGQDKDASRQAASRLLPAHAGRWPLKRHDGRAESALLALYAAQMKGLV